LQPGRGTPSSAAQLSIFCITTEGAKASLFAICFGLAMMLPSLVAHATELLAPFRTGRFCLKGNSSDDGRAGPTAGMDRVTRGGQGTDTAMAEKDREIDRLSKSPCGAVEKPQAALYPAAQPEITDHKQRDWRVRKPSHQVCWGIEEMTKHSNGVPET
jgi:hypothetical protein